MIDVNGRIHSTEKNVNVVAGANEILDDAKGKKQSVVNQETDASLANRYTKAETYNKTELNNMITTPNQQYVSVTANSQTTAVTDVLPATGAANTIYRVGNWDGNQFDASVYSEYAWNGSAYVHISTKTQIGEVFDISAYHATGGELAKYADLTAALDSNNGGGVPQSLQKGGMSVKFVRTSDSKYIRYNLLAQSFTTDTTQWAVDDAGVYVENPEFIDGKVDVNDRVLWAIKKDGSIYWGAGVPQQVIDYVEAKYKTIEDFIGGYLTDTTLQALLNTKVDKETGKGLIQDEVSESLSVNENPEYIEVETDADGRVLEATTKENKKIINKDVYVNGDADLKGIFNLNGAVVENTDSPEYIDAVTDSDNRVLECITKDGVKRVFAPIDGNTIKYKDDVLPAQITEYIHKKTVDLYSSMFNPKIDFRKTDDLRVLSIGNSFTEDATHYLIHMALYGGLYDNYPRNYSIYRATRGAGSFKTWVDAYHDIGSTRYTVQLMCGNTIADVAGEIDPEDIPVAGYGSVFRNALKNGNWDIITINQNHSYAIDYSQWKGDGDGGYLNELIRCIRKECPQAAIGYLMPHSPRSSYSGNSLKSSELWWEKTAKATKEFSRNYDIDFVIPQGTAIQNLRTTSLSDQYEFSTDGLHLADGIGDYCAACCYYQSIFAPRFGLSVFDNTWRDTDFDETTEGVKKINDANALLAQKAAFAAVYNRFELTNVEDVVIP